MRRYGPDHTFGARADDGWTYRGLAAAVIENEWLRAQVLVAKGADIWSLVFKPTDTEFLWRAPGGVRDPARVPPTTGDPAALWLDVYEGGWQSLFPGGGDPSSHAGADFGLHAESSLLPWDCAVSEAGPERAELTLSVRLVRTPVAASRTIGLDAGSSTLTVRETLCNLGRRPLPISYGQHITYGAPFLSEHCRIDLPGGRVRTHPVGWSPASRFAPAAITDWPYVRLADGGLGRLDEVPPEGAGYEDQAYVDDISDGWYAITNKRLGIGLAVSYPAAIYRHLWCWQVFNGPFRYPWWGQTYNLGLEPFTSATNRGIAAAVEDGSALLLEPGKPLVSELRLSAFHSRAGVMSVDAAGTVQTRD
ncbi:MAG TPA: DUF4432 family protein [Solirubrobacteraceae bacterium]|nr:DUF4432 family protein [Solirubrobacteraceae bacterium]